MIGDVPTPSETVLIQLAGIAAQVEELFAFDHQTEKAPVGLQRIKNDRRRKVEAILLLLADAEVRAYLSELKRLRLMTVKR